MLKINFNFNFTFFSREKNLKRFILSNFIVHKCDDVFVSMKYSFFRKTILKKFRKREQRMKSYNLTFTANQLRRKKIICETKKINDLNFTFNFALNVILFHIKMSIKKRKKKKKEGRKESTIINITQILHSVLFSNLALKRDEVRIRGIRILI